MRKDLEKLNQESKKRKKDPWWVADTYFREIQEKEIMKKNVDFKLSKINFS